MTTDSWIQVAYLVILLIAVGGFLLVELSKAPGKAARGMLAWALIFLGIVAVAGLWPDIRNVVTPRMQVEGGRIEIPLGPDGHFHLRAQVNGEDLSFIVDTGASTIALSRDDARHVGLDPDSLGYIATVRTANGETRAAPVYLKLVEIGDIRDTGVPALVVEGELEGSLLGMDYLRSYARISIEGDRLVLER